jgi:hypothetical protein
LVTQGLRQGGSHFLQSILTGVALCDQVGKLLGELFLPVLGRQSPNFEREFPGRSDPLSVGKLPKLMQSRLDV